MDYSNIILLLTLLMPSITWAVPELFGDVRGPLNATTVASIGGQTASNIAQATKAANAGTLQLNGDVIGPISQNFVRFVNGVPANQISAGAVLALGATAAATAEAIVMRDSSANFSANQITLLQAPIALTDAVNKQYVDTVVALGLEPKNPAQALAASNIAILSGLPTVDGVSLANGDTILLIAQTNAINNGLWLVASGAWTRPSDFQNGTGAGMAYVLILSGNTYAGSSWVCNTPNSIIGTDDLVFVEFSLPSQTTGNNVGSGNGEIYADNDGVVMNFRTLTGDQYVAVSTDTVPNTVSITSNATSANTNSTIVARDSSGNFSASTITAALAGNATTATTATNFSGSLVGDVTGTQGATIVSTVGGQTASNVALATVAANAATSSNTPNTIVARDGSGDFSAGTITATLNGEASLNVLKTGDTMSGPLALAAGNALNPALNYSADGTTNGTGLYFPDTHSVSLSTNGLERMNIDSSGQVTMNNLNFTGVVHTNSSGNLSSSLITNADISSSAAIADTKLDTISTSGKVSNSATSATSSSTPNAIVARDGSRNFSAGTITANLTGNVTGSVIGDVTGTASGNLSLNGGTLTGALALPSGTVTAPALNYSADGINNGTGLYFPANHSVSLSTNGVQRMNINSSGQFTINSLASATGVVHNDISGNLTSSLIVNSDVSSSAAIADTKLATISTSGKVSNSATTATSSNTNNAIVARDGSGNFSAGTITASLTGIASGNLPTNGGTLTGTLTIPAGTDSAPSLKFADSTNTGLSAQTPNVLSFDTNGSQRMSISNTAITTAAAMVLTQLLCNQAIQIVDVNIIGQTITIDPSVSILYLNNISGADVTVNLIFPASPTNGQLLTITGLTNGFNMNLNYSVAPNSINDMISTINPALWNANTGGTSVTYIYFASSTTWNRLGRG